jgi:uncharacterized protein YukE
MGAGASGEISIHPDQIHAQAPAFATASSELQTALATLTTALSGLGAPWGGDDQGREFAKAYTPQHDALIKSFGTLVEGLASINDGLAAHASNHQVTDQHNASRLRTD